MATARKARQPVWSKANSGPAPAFESRTRTASRPSCSSTQLLLGEQRLERTQEPPLPTSDASFAASIMVGPPFPGQCFGLIGAREYSVRQIHHGLGRGDWPRIAYTRPDAHRENGQTQPPGWVTICPVRPNPPTPSITAWRPVGRRQATEAVDLGDFAGNSALE